MSVILTDADGFGNMKPFEILRPGSFTAKDGSDWTFTAKDLADMAASYDPALSQAPLCVGHPAGDKPAYGWVGGLKVENGALVAELDQVEPQFEQMVQDGRFKNRSVRLWPPAAKGNPKPGEWYVRHVAFLGAVPPAVPGLKPVEFSADEDDTIEFSLAEDLWSISSLFRSVAAIARGFREYVLAEKGQDEADRLAANWQIDDMVAQAERIAAEARDATPAFSSHPTQTTEEPVKVTQEQLDARAAELDAREAELAKRKTEVDARDAAFSASERASLRKENERELDELIKAGKLAPGIKAGVLDFMDGLDAADSIEFSAGDGTTKVEKTPLAFFTELLKRSGTVIDFSERATNDVDSEGAVSFSAPEGHDVDPARLELHNKAIAYQAKHPNTDYMAAVRAVGGR